ncbi:hypothetical protein IQ07DRAFT_592771 [Pyrenochaeta sp. DS3sAY3a]|nr:hypothetical protein IQ07DRAFT_592771 [Pyrenochaeta sp. DS3sAY3a]
MHFITSISFVSALLLSVNAAPVLSERSTQCPGMSQLTSADNCSSGFIGCVQYEKSSEVCNGPKRFYNDCSGAPGLGSFYTCNNGFSGCTTNSNICNEKAPAPKPQDPTPTPVTPTPVTPTPVTPTPTPATNSWSCPPGTWYAKEKECSSGFVGCTNDSPNVCPGQQRFWGSCPPQHGNYYKCANGFVGCTTNDRICG